MDKEQKKMETLRFVTDSMNHLSLIGAREEMRKLGGIDVLSHVGDDPIKTQIFLEWVYVGNRVGGGVQMELLDKETILSIWLPVWWIELWEKLKPLIVRERKRRNIEELYTQFEWFVEELR